MTSEISELSVADLNNQIFQDLIVSIGYRKLVNLTCYILIYAAPLQSLKYLTCHFYCPYTRRVRAGQILASITLYFCCLRVPF